MSNVKHWLGTTSDTAEWDREVPGRKVARDSRILCVQNTNLLFCTQSMMKIWWNLCIWYLNKFMMQVQGNMYRGTYQEQPLFFFPHHSTDSELTPSSVTSAKYARTYSESVYSKWGNTFLLTVAVLNMGLEERIKKPVLRSHSPA